MAGEQFLYVGPSLADPGGPIRPVDSTIAPTEADGSWGLGHRPPKELNNGSLVRVQAYSADLWRALVIAEDGSMWTVNPENLVVTVPAPGTLRLG